MSSMPDDDTVIVLELSDHLTREALLSALSPWTGRLRGDPRSHMLLVDCRTMTGYEGDARTTFVEWNRAHRDRITRVAVVTENTLWHMVVTAMSLASGQDMRAFTSLDAARGWLSAAGPGKR